MTKYNYGRTEKLAADAAPVRPAPPTPQSEMISPSYKIIPIQTYISAGALAEKLSLLVTEQEKLGYGLFLVIPACIGESVVVFVRR